MLHAIIATAARRTVSVAVTVAALATVIGTLINGSDAAPPTSASRSEVSAVAAPAAVPAARPSSQTVLEPQSATEPSWYRVLRTASVIILVDDHLNGSGAFVDANGTVLTAAHVIGAKTAGIRVVDTAGAEFAAKPLAIDRAHDIALLQTDHAHPGSWLTPAADPPHVGEDVFLIGAPLYRHGVVIRGTPAREGTTFEYVDDRYLEVTHISAMTTKGASGGPWVNRRGELVGVQSSILALGDAPQGVSFAADHNAVRRLLKSRTDQVAASLGAAIEELWEQPPDTLKKFPPGSRGLLLRKVRSGGAAEKAKLPPLALIVAADGQPIRFRDELLRTVRAKRPGDKLALTFRRGTNDTLSTVEVTLDELH